VPQILEGVTHLDAPQILEGVTHHLPEFVGLGVDDLEISWSDCGDASTHGTVSGLTHDVMTLGEQTTITGTGIVDEAISGGTFVIELSAFMVSETYTGDICTAKTFDIRHTHGHGNRHVERHTLPRGCRGVSLDLDIMLSSTIPSSLAKSTVQVSATETSGDNLLCMTVKTEP
jgi:hypothetical protein